MGQSNSTPTPIHSRFNCEFHYNPEEGGPKYQNDLGENQYRRLPHNIINDPGRLLWIRSKRRRLSLGDRVKIVIHNFILGNIQRGSPLGFPGEAAWNKALFEEILRVEPRVTLKHVEKWVRNHVWIKRRHCNFKNQKNGDEAWPVEPCEEKLIRRGDTHWPFKCHHLYNSGSGTFYHVNFSMRQYPRLPNNYIGKHSRPHYERRYGSLTAPTKKSVTYGLRGTNVRGRRIKKAVRRFRPLRFPIGDTIKLIIHNFLLDNVNKGLPHGEPGSDGWNRAVLKQIKIEFPIVREEDVARWVQGHCWIRLKHKQFVQQQ